MDDTSDVGLRWLFLDLNSYFASVEQHLNPNLMGRALVVVPVMTDSTCVIAASYEAKAHGVKTGTPVWEAKRRIPGLVVLQARHQHYVRLHHQILTEIERHVPISEVCSIDEVACVLEGSHCQPQRAMALAHRIKAGISENIGPALRCSIGIAPNRFWAKVASDMQKPDGLVVLPRSVLAEVAASLQLGDLPGIGPRMSWRLAEVHGLRHPGQLWDKSPKALRQLWGSIVGERFWYALHGVELTPTTSSQRRSISHSHVLAPELRPPDIARLVARRLVAKAASRMRRLGYTASGLGLRYRSWDAAGAPVRPVADRRFHPTDDSFALLATLETLWQQLHAAKKTRIKKISVVLFGLSPASQRQLSLFDVAPPAAASVPAPHLPQAMALPAPAPSTFQKRQRLSAVLDRLNQRHGRDTVMLGILPDLHRGDVGTKVAFTRVPEMAEFYE
jgi:DNA polymerase-4